MFKFFFVLSVLVLTINARINRRLLDDSYGAINPFKSGNNANVGLYCVGTKRSGVRQPRKYLGLERSLDLDCNRQWFYKDYGDNTNPDEKNIALYTKLVGQYKIGNLYLSTLPDRLSPIEEKPERFVTTGVSSSTSDPVFVIRSQYADDEFNKFSLLCHTNDELIYKEHTDINTEDDDCQWQFTEPPTTTLPPPLNTKMAVKTDTINAIRCYDINEDNPCELYDDEYYFKSCASCCNFIQCDDFGNAHEKLCSSGTMWDPVRTACVSNDGTCTC